MYNYFCPLGLKIVLDLSKSGGERVSSVLVKSRLISQQGHYEPMQDDETYKVIVSDYTWDGGDGFKFDNDAQSLISIGKYYSILAYTSIER